MSIGLVDQQVLQSVARKSDPKIFAGGAWVTAFAILAYLFQIGLFLLGNTPLRTPFRMGVYVVSLGYLCVFGFSGKRHPAARFIPLIFILLFINLANPEGAGIFAGFAQMAIYLACLAPLFWVASAGVGIKTFRSVLLVMWIFYTASATLGVLQVKYPGRFDGALSNVFLLGKDRVRMLKLADGTEIMRPKGFTDAPGGAGTGGMYSVILGTGLLISSRRTWVRCALGGTMAIGVFAVYISQMRANFVIVGVSLSAVIIVLSRRQMLAKLSLLLTLTTIAVIGGVSAAFYVGGQSTIDRFSFQLSEDHSAQARTDEFMNFVTYLIPEYPMGAGAGRCGMMNIYFGDESRGLWAEDMWQTLIYDGGILLIVAYLVIIATTLRASWRIAGSVRDDEIGSWAGVIFGFTLATVAASLIYPVYLKEEGMEMFLLNAVLFSVAGAGNNRQRGPIPKKNRTTKMQALRHLPHNASSLESQ
jgi:hypothetical protein